MQPILWVVPVLGTKINGFSVMFLMAVLGAVALTTWRAKREGMDPNDVLDLAPWLSLGGLIGARIVFLLMHPETIETFADVFRIWKGGIVFYGCILGGLIGSTIFWTRRRFPFLPMCDAVAPSLALGLALGRVGCWLNGCCYGAISSVPWAVCFPAGSPAWSRHIHDGLIEPAARFSLAVHPTQLYSIVDGLVLLALLTWFFPRRRRDGEVMALLMVTYPVTRFLVESLRGDEGGVVAGLTVSQAISLTIFAGGLATWAWLSKKPVGRYLDRPRATAELSGLTRRPALARATR